MKVEIGSATLYLGDCMDILPTLPKVDAVITDPPYGVGFKYESHDDRPEAYEGGYNDWLMKIIEQCEEKCLPGSPIFIWQSGTHIHQFAKRFPRDWRLFIAAKNFVQMRPTAMQWSFDPVIVWWIDGEKPWSAGTATRDFHIANTAPVIGQALSLERGHPCPRPLDQVTHIVNQWVKPESICLDPFMGSGTTGVAAIQLGRKFIGIEREPKYFDIACKRIEQAVAQGQLFEPEQTKQVQEQLI
jgi:site-specific DNA-methyltransferase (adenine-specific)/modification methylase